jgi:hypothetical protein
MAVPVDGDSEWVDELADMEANEPTDMKTDQLADMEADQLVDMEADELVDMEADELVDKEADELVDKEADELADMEAVGPVNTVTPALDNVGAAAPENMVADERQDQSLSTAPRQAESPMPQISQLLQSITDRIDRLSMDV